MFALIGAAVAIGGVAVKPYVAYFTPVVSVGIVLLGLSMVFGKTALFEKFGGRLSSYSSKLGGRARYSGLFLYGVGYGLASMGCQAPVFIALIFAGLSWMISHTNWPVQEPTFEPTVRELGNLFLTKYLLPFELISLLLLFAMVGAIILVRKEMGEPS